MALSAPPGLLLAQLRLSPVLLPSALAMDQMALLLLLSALPMHRTALLPLSAVLMIPVGLLPCASPMPPVSLVLLVQGPSVRPQQAAAAWPHSPRHARATSPSPGALPTHRCALASLAGRP